MSFQDLVQHGVQFGDQQGAEYIELRYIHSVMEGYTIRNGDILAAGETETAGIGIRALVDGGMSFVSTSQLEKEEIERTIKSAIRLARASQRKTPIVLSEEPVVQTHWKVPVKIPFGDIDSETKLKRFLEVDNELKTTIGEKVLPYRMLLMVTERAKKFIATNEGTRVESDYSLARYMAILTAQGTIGTEQRGFGYGAAGGWEFYDSPEFMQTFINEAKAVQQVAEKAKPITFEKPLDVIIGFEVAGIIAHENAGHPSEADRIQGREGANAGESFWMDIDVGKTRIGSSAVNVIDDPSIPGSGGYYLYDDEGVKARPRYLIKEGIAFEMLHDRQTAGRAGVQSNGSSRATRFDREPIPRMANTYIAPGEYAFEELLEDIKHGVYIANFTEWNIDDRRYQSKYVGSLAQVIKNGEITDEYVYRPVLELTSRGLFKAVDAVSRGFAPGCAICGKSDPGQGIPVWAAGPEAVRMRNIRLGGIPT